MKKIKMIKNRNLFSFLSGGAVASLGGLIGLGGAEFRLPILVGFFAFGTITAVIINKVVSLCVVLFSLIFRTNTIGFDLILPEIDVIINILIGSLFGAYLGANYALKIKQELLNKIILVLLVLLAFSMLFGHSYLEASKPLFENSVILFISGVVAEVLIGVIAAVLGGEFIIPTLILLFGIEPKLAGSISLCISFPTMIMAFTRYSRSEQFKDILKEKTFILYMIFGSIIGAFIGSLLLEYVNSQYIALILGFILLVSAWKVFKAEQQK
ncbi:TSUP family transporter [Aliarcobacter lanthieri]|uniref:TSUP family transporter n=1 Tax=Aliarcobacter lanthieri TaxID=1355374 RepID=UPI003AAF61BC